MKKICIGFLALLFFSLNAMAQPSNPDVILTKEQNQKWLWDLEVLTLKEQISKIQKRIIADSNFYEHKKPVIRDGYEPTLQPVISIDGVILTVCKGASKDDLSQLLGILNNVISIKILEKEQATPLVGRRGEAGYITMQTNQSKTEEKLRKLNLTGGDCP